MSKPKYRCAECHSPSVQIVVWYDPNADKVDEPFADDCTEPDMGPFSVTWCGGCSEHTRLEAVRCEHSACSQNYIDTGDTACIKGGDDE